MKKGSFLQPLGSKRTQTRFKMQQDGEPIWDQTTIDRLWVTTQREVVIESGPAPVTPAPVSAATAAPTASSTPPAEKAVQRAPK